MKSFTPVSDFTEETPQSAYGCQLPFQGSLLRKLFVCSSATMSKPSGGIRSLPSLSACGLPTPVVALACIGNVDIQEFSCAGGRLYFIRRLQVCCYKPPLKGVEGFFREVHLLVQPCQNRPAEFARCPRCPPVACQRRWLPFPVSVMLVFKSFLVQVGNFISYGVCKFICLSSFMYNRFHKELRFFFSLLIDCQVKCNTIREKNFEAPRRESEN